MNPKRAPRFVFVVSLFLVTFVFAPIARAERVELQTADGFTLVGDLLAGEAEAPAIVLLHMYQSNRRAFAPLVPKLREAGYTVLALDQRTHGESTRSANGRLRVQDIPRGGFGAVLRAGVADVAAARALLAARGLGGGGLVLVGASYGCSVSLLATETPGIRAVVLLSPGAAYFGVNVLRAAESYPGALLAVAAEDDASSARGARSIVEAHMGAEELVIYPDGGHGTRLFSPRPEVLTRIVDFLGRAL